MTLHASLTFVPPTTLVLLLLPGKPPKRSIFLRSLQFLLVAFLSTFHMAAGRTRVILLPSTVKMASVKTLRQQYSVDRMESGYLHILVIKQVLNDSQFNINGLIVNP